MPRLYDSLIIGAGPAGLSAALGLGRVHRTCAIFSNSTFRNAGVHAAHTILGHDGKSPEQIRSAGRAEIEAYGHAEFIESTITKVSKQRTSDDRHDTFILENQQGQQWQGRTLIIATGTKDVFPEIPGYAENWPFNIYQCLFCDGHERYQQLKGILCYPAPNPLSIKMASMAHFLSFPPGTDKTPTSPPRPSMVTFFSNGPANPENTSEIAEGLEKLAALGIKVDERPVSKLVRDEKEGVHLHFNTGESVHLGWIFHKPNTKPNEIAESIIEHLGLDTTSSPQGRTIKTTPPFNATNVPGVFAAGDSSTFMTQVTNAMLTGCATAAAVSHFCNDWDDGIALSVWKEAGVQRDRLA